MAASLNLVEEKRKQTITNIVAYQQHLISNYNKIAKIRQFQPEYLVLRKAFIIARRSSYTNANMNDKEIEKQWNTYNLKKYHV
ncbi:hypothetical protein ACFX19_014849 [Malus domestica]